MYFDTDGLQRSSKVWKWLGERPGYMFEYHECRKRLNADGGKSLDRCLEELLMLCQCLPDSSRGKSGGCVWRVERNRMKRVGRIGPSRKAQGTRAAPAHRSARSTVIAMMMHEDVPEEVAQKAYDAAQRHKDSWERRSAKSRNRRKPPPKRGQSVASEAEEGDDEDKDDDDDDEDDEDDEADEEDNVNEKDDEDWVSWNFN
jgi:hypothetical protein